MNANGVPSTRTPLHLLPGLDQAKVKKSPSKPVKAKGGRKTVSQDEYLTTAKQAEALLRAQGSRLLEVARLLGVTTDFSPATLTALRDSLKFNKEVIAQCKLVEDITLKRGHAYYDEQKAKLNEGTLKLMKRETDSE